MNGLLRAQFARSALLMFFTTAIVVCAVGQGQDEHEIAQAGKQLAKASDVLDDMMEKPDRSIPEELLEEADAIAVFPRVINDAFTKGRAGDGIVLRRLENGWSMPVFYKLNRASFSPQVGSKKTDYIILFMNDDAAQHLQDDKFELGGEGSFDAGPADQAAEAGTDGSSPAGILTWSRSKGPFVGASLTGAAITPDDGRNLAVYGMYARELIASQKIVLKRVVSKATTDYQWRSTRD